jgi:predicted PurR-regulated permease PerM
MARTVQALVFVVAIALVAWFLRGTLLLVFAGALFGIALRRVAEALHRLTRLPMTVAVWLGAALGAIVIAGALSLGGGAIVAQWEELTRLLHDAFIATIRELQAIPAIASAVSSFDPSSLLANAGGFLERAGGIVSGAFGMLVALLVIVFVAVAGALEPSLYRSGFLALFPVPYRERMSVVIDQTVATLGTWIVARSISMCVTGLLVWLALSILHVPLAGALGALAGVLAFVPNIGAFVAGAPAVIIAFAISPRLAVFVLFAYWLVHFIDDFLVSPFIERRMVRLPPILTLVAQIALGIAAGTVGIMLAAPLVATTIVVVERLWVDPLERTTI